MTDIAGPSSAELAAIIEGRTAEEIAASIARHVRQAPLSADTPLPTVRGLATELGVSASTVSDAWRILRARGVIYTDRRRGTTVRLDRTAAGGRAWHVPVEIAGDLMVVGGLEQCAADGRSIPAESPCSTERRMRSTG